MTPVADWGVTAVEFGARIVFAISMAGMFLTGFYSLWQSRRLLTHLERHHTVVWQTLGRPTLIMNNSIQNNLAVMKFVWVGNSVANLGDNALTNMTRKIRLITITHLILFAGSLISFFLLL